MSREIKFRVWDTFQKKYIFEGFHVIGEVTVFGGMDSVISDTWEARSAALGYETSIEAWNDFETEQFTGLKDAKSQDIYEGDIVTTTPSGSCLHSLLSLEEFVTYAHGKVVWEAGSWKVRQPHLGSTLLYYFVDCECCPTGSIEVIGNIHEHSHLLKS